MADVAIGGLPVGCGGHGRAHPHVRRYQQLHPFPANPHPLSIITHAYPLAYSAANLYLHFITTASHHPITHSTTHSHPFPDADTPADD